MMPIHFIHHQHSLPQRYIYKLLTRLYSVSYRFVNRFVRDELRLTWKVDIRWQQQGAGAKSCSPV